MRYTRTLLTATASLLLFTACSSDDTSTADSAPASAETTADTATTDAPAGDDAAADAGGAAAGAGAAVGLSSSRFDPTELEIAAGESVTFTNNDPFNHTITSKDGSPIEYDSGNFGEGETFEQTYDEAGSYEFFCQIHPTMRGTITVG